MRFTLNLAPLAMITVLLLAACGGPVDPTPTALPAATATPSAVAVPTATPTTGPDGQSGGTLDLNALLTIADVEAAFPTLSSITTSEVDYYELAQQTNPAQTVGWDAFKGLVFQSGGPSAVMFIVADFETQELAESHFETTTVGLETTILAGGEDARFGHGGGLIALVTLVGEYVVGVNTSGLPESEVEISAAKDLMALALSRLP